MTTFLQFADTSSLAGPLTLDGTSTSHDSVIPVFNFLCDIRPTGIRHIQMTTEPGKPGLFSRKSSGRVMMDVTIETSTTTTTTLHVGEITNMLRKSLWQRQPNQNIDDNNRINTTQSPIVRSSSNDGSSNRNESCIQKLLLRSRFRRRDQIHVKKGVWSQNVISVYHIWILLLVIIIILVVGWFVMMITVRHLLWYHGVNHDDNPYSYVALQQQQPVLLSLPKVIWNQSDSSIGMVSDSVDRNRNIYCHVATDVRGNLGPASVLLDYNHTTDWIHDRWQAASDMHGTNIHGHHSVQLDWSYSTIATTTTTNNGTSTSTDRAAVPTLGSEVEGPTAQPVVIQRIVLDWEAAYSDNYDIQILNSLTTDVKGVNEEGEESGPWRTIFTMRPFLSTNQVGTGKVRKKSSSQVTTTGGTVTISEWGQSPGVTFPTPLHVCHTIALSTNKNRSNNNNNNNNSSQPSSSSGHYSFPSSSSKLRIMIYTSATGWGVSLWQVQVYGYYMLGG
jgi:hypothetical protein